jgi:hypothetical protein
MLVCMQMLANLRDQLRTQVTMKVFDKSTNVEDSRIVLQSLKGIVSDATTAGVWVCKWVNTGIVRLTHS